MNRTQNNRVSMLIQLSAKVILTLMTFVIYNTTTFAQESDNYQIPKDAKLIKEYEDGKGNIVKEVRYTQGNMRVTETIISPKPVGRIYGYRAPINPDTLDKDSLIVKISKKFYCVQVYYKSKMIRSYKAVFGPKPLINKCMEGDRCTPEGWFTINDKHISSKYNKFLGFNYPNAADRRRFTQLKDAGKIPKNARIGGNIGIHGIWNGGDDMIELGVGWTDGCIALKNHDINDLYRIIGVGTRIHIRK